jgi:DNA-directed RNA polymerase specialized sigma24 family protein
MPPRGKSLDQVAGHREEDLRAWMAQYGPALRRYFQKKVGPAEAEDLVQDVFVSLQVRGGAEAIDNIEGYLFRIAANALMRRYKRRGWDWAGHEPLGRLGAERDGEPGAENGPDQEVQTHVGSPSKIRARP